MFKIFLEFGKLNPKILILINGIGAITSAIFWGIILVRQETLVGIPKKYTLFIGIFSLFICDIRFLLLFQFEKKIEGLFHLNWNYKPIIRKFFNRNGFLSF
ncbi:MAG: hypothetical protein MK202_16845 [Tenacibaculum sp.]|nr:hypothetical protein [Tenacibaculum sp.]